MAPPPNELCPVLADVTLCISLSFCIITIILMYLFWKSKGTPAFESRRPMMTLSVSCCIMLSMTFPNLAAYNICNKGEIQYTLYFNLSAAAIYLYSLWLISYRTWILFINWKMAITQLTELDHTPSPTESMDDIKTNINIWWSIYKYFANQTAIRCWYILLTIWIFVILYVADTDIYFHVDCIGQWVLRSCFIFWCLVSVILVLTTRNMRDHFALMTEMKIYIALNVVLVTIFIIVAERLSDWATTYSPPQLVQIKIILNTIRSGISSVLFLGFPLFKFRFSFQGILFDINISSPMSSTEKKLTDLVKMDIDARSRTSSLFLNVDSERYPSLVIFLSRNKKPYQAFKTHLATCLAVENLLFFAKAQRFRCQLQLAMRAKSESVSHGNKVTINMSSTDTDGRDVHGLENDIKKDWILSLDFFYLQKTNGYLQFDSKGIKQKWLHIYDNFISSSSPYQINVDYDKFQEIELFKQRIEANDDGVTVDEYLHSFEAVTIEVWGLMERLYLHFQLTDDYMSVIKHNFPIYNKIKKTGNTLDVVNEEQQDNDNGNA